MWRFLLGIFGRARPRIAAEPNETETKDAPGSAFAGAEAASAEDSEDNRKKLGALGEAAAATYLKKNGLKILKRNYICRYGEIDLIALDGDKICFVEVKTRRPRPLLEPVRTVTAAKRRKVRAVAKHYLRSKGLMDRVCRFDVASVIYPEEGDPEIEWLRHAF